MKTQKITPVGKRILILEKTSEEFYPGTSIHIPETARKKTYPGYVIGVGKDVKDINVGDLIQYVDYALPIEMMHNNQKHLLIVEGDVLAVISNE